MPRVEVPIVVVNNSGVPLAGASVQIKYRSNGVNAPWYTSEISATPSTAAVVTDANGRVSAWVDRGAYNAVITGTGITGYTEPFDAMPAADQSVDYALLGASVLDRFIPIGAALAWEGDADPTGGYFMIEDGRAISRTTYATLYAILGTKHGTGDGSTTFNLPDSRGRVWVGKGTATEINTVGKNEGIAAASLSQRRFAHAHGGTGLSYSHTHSIASGGGHSHTVDSHAHEHVYPIAKNGTRMLLQAPGSGYLDGHGSVSYIGTGSYSMLQAYNPGPTEHVEASVTDTVERWITQSDWRSPGTNTAGAHDHGGTGAVNSGSFGGSTAESAGAFIVKNKIIRVL